MELWLDIPGYEGHYRVSNQGRILSLKRGGERLIPLTPNKRGYIRVPLWKDGKCHMHSVHRLVLDTFLPSDDPTLEPDHKFGIRHDNRLSELEWVTREENLRRARERNGGNRAKTWKITFPTGEEIIQKSLRQFCLSQGWNGNAMTRGHHKGFTCQAL